MSDITTALFLPFKFPLSNYSAVVVDSAGTNTRTFIPLATAWYIQEFAHSGSPAGTVDDPINLLRHVESQLGSARWSVALNDSGKVVITYNSTGVASITFATSAIPNALGLNVNSLTFSAGESKIATYQPTHCLYGFSREEDSGWRSKGQIVAAVDSPDGSVYGWTNGYNRWERSFTMKFHPKDVTVQNASVANITVAYPPKTSTQWKNPTDSPIIPPPFSAHQFFNSGVNNGVGKYIAACFGNFKANIAGTDLTFEQVTFTAQSLKSEHFLVSIKNFDRYRDLDNFRVSFYSHKSRNTQ